MFWYSLLVPSAMVKQSRKNGFLDSESFESLDVIQSSFNYTMAEA
jgi:hypothetical protein